MCDATVDGVRYEPTPRRQRGATAGHAACRWLEPGTYRDARVLLRSPSSPSPTPPRSRRTTSVRSRQSHPSIHIVVNGGPISKVSTLRLVPAQSARSRCSRAPLWAAPPEGRARRDPPTFCDRAARRCPFKGRGRRRSTALRTSGLEGSHDPTRPGIPNPPGERPRRRGTPRTVASCSTPPSELTGPARTVRPVRGSSRSTTAGGAPWSSCCCLRARSRARRAKMTK